MTKIIMHLFSNSFLKPILQEINTKQFALFILLLIGICFLFLFCFFFSLSFRTCFVWINRQYEWKKNSLNTHRFISANAWNGCARNNAARAADDANDATISVISSWTAVYNNGGPGNKYNNCNANSSSISNCTYLRYLFNTTPSTTDNNNNNSNHTSNY